MATAQQSVLSQLKSAHDRIMGRVEATMNTKEDDSELEGLHDKLLCSSDILSAAASLWKFMVVDRSNDLGIVLKQHISTLSAFEYELSFVFHWKELRARFHHAVQFNQWEELPGIIGADSDVCKRVLRCGRWSPASFHAALLALVEDQYKQMLKTVTSNDLQREGPATTSMVKFLTALTTAGMMQDSIAADAPYSHKSVERIFVFIYSS